MAKKKAAPKSKPKAKAKPKAKPKAKALAKVAAKKKPAAAVAKKKMPVRKPVVKKKAAPPPVKDGRPPNYYAWLTPMLCVRDVTESQKFLAAAFGITVGMSMPGPDGKVMHGDVLWNGTTLAMMGPENPQHSPMKSPASSGAPAPMSLYVYCKDVDALHARASAAGAKVLQAPADQFWGDRIAVYEDPDGYNWTFATNVRPFDPSKVPF